MNEDKKIEETIPPIKVPGPEEGLGTAKQLKQFYHSEQWKDIAEGFHIVWKKIKEEMFPVIHKIAVALREISISFFSDPEVKRCYRIYKRTKKGRIAKKQLKRINKIIFKRYYNK